MNGPSIHGYADQLSASPGDVLHFMISSDGVDSYSTQLTRLIHGDDSPEGRGFRDEDIPGVERGRHLGRHQDIQCGSHMVAVDQNERLRTLDSGLTFCAFIFPTTPTKPDQGIISCWEAESETAWCLGLTKRRLAIGSATRGKVTWAAESAAELESRRWYFVAGRWDTQGQQASVFAHAVVNSTNSEVGPIAAPSSRDQEWSREAATLPPLEASAESSRGFLVAALPYRDPRVRAGVTGHFNGKIELPSVYSVPLSKSQLAHLAANDPLDTAGLLARWDFSVDIRASGVPSDSATDTSGHELDGVLRNHPARAVTGRNWAGAVDDFTRAPDEFAAIHFHDDDLDDAGWDADFSVVLPEELRSGVYAMRLEAGEVTTHIPFFVRPSKAGPRADVAVLFPTATYMAYANERSVFDAEWTEEVDGGTPVLTHEDLYLNSHLDYGLSLYDVHSDGSGVCYSSRLRPIVNMSPRYRHRTTLLEELPADLCLVAWLDHIGMSFDVLTDEDLARDASVVSTYRTVLTGSHPEYCSSSMLDALEGYLVGGGRLMYLGGNGFYWVTSFDPKYPHVIEVRRGNNGTRAWSSEPGETHHSTTGELGGLWRNRGRPPQKLAGVGFVAQGFDGSTYYVRLPDSDTPRASFIFEGVDADVFGDFGKFGGGAAGQEVDRYDRRLGSPKEAFLVGSSVGLSDGYRHVVEDLKYSVPGLGGSEDVEVRSDVVYYPVEGGGAVFSVGSMAWCGALEHNGYENDIARITENVLRQFLHAGPLPGSDS